MSSLKCATIVVWAAVAGLVVRASGEQTTFRGGVDVVVVPVSVTDRNLPVKGLVAADFEVLDNGVRQDVTLAPIDRLPVDVTLVIDTSASVMGKTLDEVKADLQQMGDIMQPSDRVRVISMANSAIEVVPQRPAGAILPVDRISGGGTTALYDGLVAALAAYPYSDRPQVVFAVTDGRDTSSFLDADELMSAARVSSALLCVALVNPSGAVATLSSKVEAVNPAVSERSIVTLPSGLTENGVTGQSIARSMGPYQGEPNVPALKSASAATGGAFYANPNGGAIPELFRRMMDDVRSGYLLTYSPAGTAASGWHAVTVHTKDSRQTVRARSGYQRK